MQRPGAPDYLFKEEVRTPGLTVAGLEPTAMAS